MSRVTSSSASGNSTINFTGSQVNVFNEITSVSAGIETVVAIFTNNTLAIGYLQKVSVAGNNMAEYRIYLNDDIIDKQYSSLTQFNLEFNYLPGNSGHQGLELERNDKIYVKVIHNRPDLGIFSARIQGFENQ